MSTKSRGPAPRTDPRAALAGSLKASFRWRGDRTDDSYRADPTGWWAEPGLLRRLGPALAALFPEEAPTVVLGLQSRGALLGALTAVHLGVGLVEVRKDPAPSADSDRWFVGLTPPDYRDRTLSLGLRRELLSGGDRALLVDDWIETGGQAVGVRHLVRQAGARWLGTAVIVDGLQDSRLRRDLAVRSLLHVRDL